MSSNAGLNRDTVPSAEGQEPLIGVDDLVESMLEYNPGSDSGLIRRVYEYARLMHRGSRRSSGAEYFTHPAAVAKILADRHLDDASVATALLHDTVEDTAATLQDIRERFDDEIMSLVDGVTKLSHFKASKPNFEDAKNFFRMMLATSRDGRTLIVKLADRLHNMRTISHLNTGKRRRIAKETLGIYAPLAEQVGLPEWSEEMEDLAFKTLAPRFHSSIERRFSVPEGPPPKEPGKVTPTMVRQLQAIEGILDQERIDAEVSYRKKKPFSIIRGSVRRDLELKLVPDTHGFRIITNTIKEAYQALGAIHCKWPFIQERFKDYISVPKRNGYRSIHTVIKIRGDIEVEIQIRTKEMHEIAESGVAAHWVYKNGSRIESKYLPKNPYQWLEQMNEDFDAAVANPGFWKRVELSMTEDFVFCFSPLGDVVRLPKDSMPLDFAYKIHTRLGDTYDYAKVNGSRVPMDHQLVNGQTVEIFTSELKHPKDEWKRYVRTDRAHAAIQRFLNESHRRKQVADGQKLARKAFAEMGREWNEKALSIAMETHELQSGDELFAKIASMEISTLELKKSVYPEEFRVGARNTAVQTKPVRNLPDNCIPDYAKCCCPVPGEDILGVRRKNNVVRVHARDCKHLKTMKGQPFWLNLSWSEGPYAAVFPATFEVKLTNKAGALGRVCTLIGDQNANISDLHFVDRNPDLYKMHVDIEFRDTKHMKNVWNAIESDRDVVEISRYRMPVPKPNRPEQD